MVGGRARFRKIVVSSKVVSTIAGTPATAGSLDGAAVRFGKRHAAVTRQAPSCCGAFTGGDRARSYTRLTHTRRVP
jgi:hypothetical protein